MPNLECPYCEHAAYFETTDTWLWGDLGTMEGVWANLGKCPNPDCDGVVAVGLTGRDRHDVVGAIPLALVRSPDPLIAQPIRDDLFEARLCMSIGALKATAAMCRRALQGACIDLGATSGARLVDQIDEVIATNKVHGSLKTWADAIRFVGNAGAHPGSDGLEIVTREEAEDILAFTEQFLDLTYVVTSRVQARLTAKRTAP
jgi:hypothetical protein